MMRPLHSRCVYSLLWSLLGLVAGQVSFLPAAASVRAPVADYKFQATLASSISGAPALTNLGTGNMFKNVTLGGAARTVLSFPQNNGLSLAPTSQIIASNVYSVAVLFAFENVSGYRRVLDFKNRSTEAGLYINSGDLSFYTVASGGLGLLPNQWLQLVLTRDSNSVVNIYANGVGKMTFTDAGGAAVMGPENVLRFFQDNALGAGGEASAGLVSRIQVYNAALDASEAASLDLASGFGPASSSGPVLSVNSALLDYGLVKVGQTSSLALVLTNAGAATLTVTNLALSDSHFQVMGVTVPFSIAPSGVKSMTVQFTADAPGPRTGTLTIGSNDPSMPALPVWLQAQAAFTAGFVIEAEDFDFGGGQHKPDADQMPYFGGAYGGLSAVAEIDYHDPGGNESGYYRASDQGVAMGGIDDRSRGSYEVHSDYKIGWNDTGDWFDYTRNFPAAPHDYYIFARLASAGLPNAIRLDLVTAGAGTTNQTIRKIGEARGPASGDWNRFLTVPVTDEGGNLSTVQLSGSQTLRVTMLDGGNEDFNYLTLVPVASLADAPCAEATAGLVSWWRGEGDVADVAGNNPGTLSGGVTLVTGEIGQAFRLDGKDSTIKIPASSTLNVGQAGGLTLEAWIKPDDVTKQAPIFEWNGSVLGAHFWNYPAPGQLFANLIDTAGSYHILNSSPGVLTAGVFQHIALTYDKASGLATLYHNGLAVAQQNFGSFTPQTSHDLYFGQRPGDRRYAGVIDETALYNRALSGAEIGAIYLAGASGKCGINQAAPQISSFAPATGIPGTVVTINGSSLGGLLEVRFGTVPAKDFRVNAAGTQITATTSADVATGLITVKTVAGQASSATAFTVVLPDCVPAPAGLVGWWRAEGDAANSSGDAIGELHNGISFASGQVGQAFNLDGVDDFVGTTLDVQPSAMPSTTWEAWVYPTRINFNGRQQIFSSDDSGWDRSLLIEANTGNFGVFTGTSEVWQPVAVTPNAWQHIALVYKADDIEFYKDGVRYSRGAAAVGQSTGYKLQIGRNPGFGEYFQGKIDEVSIYDRALSASDIQAIYAAGRTGKCSSSPNAGSYALARIEVNRTFGSAGLAAVSTNPAQETLGAGVRSFVLGWNFKWPDPTSGPNRNISSATTTMTQLPSSVDPGASATFGATMAGSWDTTGYGVDRDHTISLSGAAGTNQFSNVGDPSSVQTGQFGTTNTVIVPEPVNGEISLVVDAGLRFGGDHTGAMTIKFVYAKSATPTAPRLALSATQLSFGKVTAGQNSELTIVVTNTGTAALTIASGVSSNRAFVVTSPAFPVSVAAGAAQTLRVRFAPSTIGAQTGSLILTSNDPIEPTVSISLSGEGIDTTIGNCVTAPAGLVGWWRGEGDAKDSIGTANGQLANVTFASGKVGQAFVFSGNNASVTMADSAALRPAKLTVETWVRFESVEPASTGASYVYLLSKDLGTGGHFFTSYSFLKERAAGVDYLDFRYASLDAEYGLQSKTVVSPGVTYHLAATFDGGIAKLYVNGVLEDTISLPGFTLAYDASPLRFGVAANPVAVNKFQGSLDEVSLYNRALSATEIASIYNAGAGGKCPGGSTTAPIISVSPVALDFSSVVVGASKELTLSVRNTGTASLNVSSIASSNAKFAVVSPAVPFNVAAGASSTITVRFSPTAAALETGQLTITHNDATQGPINVSLTGTGTANTGGTPQIFVSPSTLRFGDVNLGQSKELEAVVQNAGTGVLVVSNITNDNVLFKLLPITVPFGLSAGATQAVHIRFTPTVPGSQFSIFKFVNNAGESGSGVIALGNGVLAPGSPLIALSTTNVDFGGVAVGNTVPLSFVITNVGVGPLTLKELRADGTNFSVVALNGPELVSTGATRVVTVRFNPTVTGIATGSVTIVSDDPVYPTLTLPLTGLGVTLDDCYPAPAGLIAWWPGETNAKDQWGGHDGTAKNGASYMDGLDGKAFALDGQDDYLEAPDSPVWNFGAHDFSIELWASFARANGDQALVAHDPGPGGVNKWIFWYRSGVLSFHVNGSSGQRDIGAVPFTPAILSWQHLGLVRSGTKFQFFVDGTLAGEGDFSGEVPFGPAPLTLGQAENNFFFAGFLDEVSIYNRALSAAEIHSIFTAGSAGKCFNGNPTTASPRLRIERVTEGVGLFWKGNDFKLESADLLSSPTPWTPVPDAPQLVGTENVVRHALRGQKKFYRLQGTSTGGSATADGVPPGPRVSSAGGLVTAASGGTLVTSDGSVTLTIPPGALSADQTITVTNYVFQTSDGQELQQMILSPAGLRLSKPAQLTTKFSSAISAENLSIHWLSGENTEHHLGSEISQFEAVDNAIINTAARTATVAISHFSIGSYWVGFIQTVGNTGNHLWEEPVYLVFDLDGKNLKKADLLYTLSKNEFDNLVGGHGWFPGHAALYLGSQSAGSRGNDGDTIIESTPEDTVLNQTDGVQFGSLAKIKTLSGNHIFMGARRPFFKLADADRSRIAGWAIGKRNTPYSKVGGPFIATGAPWGGISCVGLTEGSYESIGKSIVPGISEAALWPLRQFVYTTPVEEVTVQVGDKFHMFVGGVVRTGKFSYSDNGSLYRVTMTAEDGYAADKALKAGRAEFHPEALNRFQFAPTNDDSDLTLVYKFTVTPNDSSLSPVTRRFFIKVRPLEEQLTRQDPVFSGDIGLFSATTTGARIDDDGAALRVNWPEPPTDLISTSSIPFQVSASIAGSPADGTSYTLSAYVHWGYSDGTTVSGDGAYGLYNDGQRTLVQSRPLSIAGAKRDPYAVLQFIQIDLSKDLLFNYGEASIRWEYERPEP